MPLGAEGDAEDKNHLLLKNYMKTQNVVFSIYYMECSMYYPTYAFYAQLKVQGCTTSVNYKYALLSHFDRDAASGGRRR